MNQKQTLDAITQFNANDAQVDRYRQQSFKAMAQGESAMQRAAAQLTVLDAKRVTQIADQRAKLLTEAPRFEHIVIGATGSMALMRTVAPTSFVAFKRWLAERPGRPPIKQRRDTLQAGIVQELMDEGLLQLL